MTPPHDGDPGPGRQEQAQSADVAHQLAPTPADAAPRPPSMEGLDAAAGVTSGHHLLHQAEPGEDETNVQGTSEVPRSIAFRLYTSHFLSTWNSRLFEFGAALFLTSVFPGTLLPVSVYSLVRNAGYILFAQPLGAWINTGNRRDVIRTSIVGQRVPVAVSCALLLVLERKESALGYRREDGIFAVIVLLAVVEKLCSTVGLGISLWPACLVGGADGD